MLITAACSTFDLAYIRWNWFCSSSVQHSIEMSCLILILWYNCLYIFLCCVLCTQCFQWISGYLKTYKPYLALPSPCEHHSCIINCVFKIEGFLLWGSDYENVFSFAFLQHGIVSLFINCRQHRSLPFSQGKLLGCACFLWFFPFLFCHCSWTHLKDLLYFTTHGIMFVYTRACLLLISSILLLLLFFVLQESDF